MDDSRLVAHARRELELAGLFDAGSDYGGMVGESVMEIVEVFARQGHSGYSAMMVVGVLERLLRFDVLVPLSGAPEEWHDVAEVSGRPLWQNVRKSSVFSEDRGATWYDIEAGGRG
jgi:hypothetical protein